MIINPGYRVFEFAQETWDRHYIEYRERWNDVPKTGKTLNMPLNLDVETTNACNLRCPFCVREYMKDNIGKMTNETFDKIIEEVEMIKLPAMKMNWRGEPTLHEQLPKMIRKAKHAGVVEVSINTNGTMFTPTLIANLIDSGLDRIIISIDSINSDVYRTQRVGAELEDTIAGLKKLLELRKISSGEYGRPYIRVQKIDLPETRQEDFVTYFKNLGVDTVAINTYKEKDETGIDWEPLPCCQPFQRMGVTWDGNFFPCCQGHMFPSIGNVKDMSIVGAWHSPMMYQLREFHHTGKQGLIPQCRKCETTRPEK